MMQIIEIRQGVEAAKERASVGSDKQFEQAQSGHKGEAFGAVLADERGRQETDALGKLNDEQHSNEKRSGSDRAANIAAAEREQAEPVATNGQKQTRNDKADAPTENVIEAQAEPKTGTKPEQTDDEPASDWHGFLSKVHASIEFYRSEKNPGKTKGGNDTDPIYHIGPVPTSPKFEQASDDKTEPASGSTTEIDSNTPVAAKPDESPKVDNFAPLYTGGPVEEEPGVSVGSDAPKVRPDSEPAPIIDPRGLEPIYTSPVITEPKPELSAITPISSENGSELLTSNKGAALAALVEQLTSATTTNEPVGEGKGDDKTEGQTSTVTPLLNELKALLSKADEQGFSALSKPEQERVGEILVELEGLPNVELAPLKAFISGQLLDKQLTVEGTKQSPAPEHTSMAVLTEDRLEQAWQALPVEAKQALEHAVAAYKNGDPKPLENLMQRFNVPAEDAQVLLDKAALDVLPAKDIRDLLAVVVNDQTAKANVTQNATAEESARAALPQATAVETSNVALAQTKAVAAERKELTPTEAVVASFKQAADESKQANRAAVQAEQYEQTEPVDKGRSSRITEALLAANTNSEPARVVAAPVMANVASTAMPAQGSANSAFTPVSAQASAATAVPDTPFEQARQTQQYIELFSPQAPRQLRDQVAVMYNNRHQFAEMRLDPPELGRLQIRVQFNSEQQASVTFTVNSPQAREAVEQAMPRLREMLEEQGIKMADANVREENQQQAQAQQGYQQSGSGSQNGNQGSGLGADQELAGELEALQQQFIDVENGRVDFYA
ncbi:flagellar hook-length control protein FliK [Aliidiomarina celeris]|uniref:flagellar hook-length control protein FliK n=1 Tax=Aliidiomarina celeris TaxID=2249428 RepID=UPI000DE92BED|nr:flagellar hook-length control protein FliK [Aliidiomarina celeris]